MLDLKTLNHIMDMLAKLNASAVTTQEKSMVLEIGYIIKQEINALMTSTPTVHEGQALDPKKLLEDNRSLYRENQTLIASIQKMENIVNTKIPVIQASMEKFNNELKEIARKCKA